MKIIIDGKEAEVGKGSDGFSPTVEVTEIDGGHQVTITDANGPQSFDVMDGKDVAEDEISIPDDALFFDIYHVPVSSDTDKIKFTADGTSFSWSVNAQDTIADVVEKANMYFGNMGITISYDKSTGTLLSTIEIWDDDYENVIDTETAEVGVSFGGVQYFPDYSPPSENGIPVKPITEAEYDALSDDEKNSETAWLVTDADSGGDSGGITQEDLESALEEKQDKLIGVAGQIVGFDASGNALAQNAPESVSMSQVNSAISTALSNSRIVLTQAQYDALTTKDPNVEYCIKEG